jgi:TatD DNase family protein
VTGILIPAIRPATWPALRALAAAHPVLRFAIGVHPQFVPDEALLEPDAIARAADGAVAIGECGLDGATADLAKQEAVFRAHIRAARSRRLPLVVHVLRAHDAAPRILREERAHEVGGVLHSYSGGAALVPVYRDLGFAFSFAGPVTFPNARKPIEAARAVDDALLLVETDSPDQSPDGHRGARNEPARLVAVVAALAAARARSPADLAALTAANATRIFGAFG